MKKKPAPHMSPKLAAAISSVTLRETIIGGESVSGGDAGPCAGPASGGSKPPA